MSTYRAILIDVTQREIREVQVEEGLAGIYNNLGCSLFTVAGNFNYSKGEGLLDSLLVDDEGLFKENNPIFKFSPPEWRSKQIEFAGNGLITGLNDLGETVSCRSTVEEIASYVKWTDKIADASEIPAFTVQIF